MKEHTTGLGVAPLSALDLPVVDYIEAAASAGYGAVGLRVLPVSPTDPVFPEDISSSAFHDIEAALESTGVGVLDIEVLSIRPQTARADWAGVLEIGEALGAQYLNVVCDEPDLARFADLVGQLTEDADAHGLAPVLEPVAYRPLDDFDRAVEIARDAGCLVELDLLHFIRTGASIDTVRRSPDLFPIVQLCDAPARIEGHGDTLRELAAAAGDTDSEFALDIAESRGLRLLPGRGAAPLQEILRILGPETHLSVEVPNITLRGDLDGAEYLRMLGDTTRELLDSYAIAHTSIDRKGMPRV